MLQVQVLRCPIPRFRIRFQERWPSLPSASRAAGDAREGPVPAGLTPLPLEPGGPAANLPVQWAFGKGKASASSQSCACCRRRLGKPRSHGVPEISTQPQHTSQEKAQPQSLPWGRSPGAQASGQAPPLTLHAASVGSALQPSRSPVFLLPTAQPLLASPPGISSESRTLCLCTSFNRSLLPWSMRPLFCLRLSGANRLPTFSGHPHRQWKRSAWR